MLTEERFFDTIIVRDYHENGSLWTEHTRKIVDKGMYKHPEGYEYIRIGTYKKWFDNGQLAWVLSYDDEGNSISNNVPNCRRDGTNIAVY